MRYAIMFPLLFACSSLPDPKAQRAQDTFACYVKAVEPFCGSVVEAEDLVRGAITGDVDLARALSLLGALPREVREVGAKLQACRPSAPEGA